MLGVAEPGMKEAIPLELLFLYLPLPKYDHALSYPTLFRSVPPVGVMLPEPLIDSLSVGLSPKCWLPLSVTVPPPMTAPVAVNEPVPEDDAFPVIVNGIEAAPAFVQTPLVFSLSVQLPLIVP